MSVAALMSSVALPVLVSVTVFDELLPTFTLLNATGDGLIPSCGWVATPDPLSPISNGDPGAVLVIETFPLAFPVAVGANVTLKVAVPPGARFWDDSALIVNPAPLALAALIDRLAVPEFVSVTFTDELLPVIRLPKLMLGGFALNAA